MRWISALVLAAGLCAAGDATPAPEQQQEQELDARACFRLALKCEANGQRAAARRHYLAVLAREPDHRAALRALRGGGRALANDALRLLRSRDAASRALGLRVVDLLAPAERQRALRIASRHPRADVRLAAVRALADPAALARAAVRDADAAVRAAAVASLRQARVASPARLVLAALGSPNATTRTRAAEALGALGDEGAVGPLVARLLVTGGSGQQVYIAQTNQISFVKDFDVEVASTAFIADPEVGVIQDGLAFSFRALGHSGTIDIHERRAVVAALQRLTGEKLEKPAAWRDWYREQRAR
jgi:hypothetical protein